MYTHIFDIFIFLYILFVLSSAPLSFARLMGNEFINKKSLRNSPDVRREKKLLSYQWKFITEWERNLKIKLRE